MKSIISFVLAMQLLFQPIAGLADINDKSFIYEHSPEIFADYTKPHELTDTEKAYVAHAGGVLMGMTGLNCLEAVEKSYARGFRLIEMDILFTEDDVPVMYHAWDGDNARLFGKKPFTVYSSEEFKSFKMVYLWHQLTLDQMVTYMCTRFPEMYLVTDTKGNNYYLMNVLKERYPGMEKRFIVQVYTRDEYEYAVQKGFPNIIYTLYRTDDTKEQVLDFCRKNKVYAITTYSDWMDDNFPETLNAMGVYTYIHTVHNPREYAIVKSHLYQGIYTDGLFDVNS